MSLTSDDIASREIVDGQEILFPSAEAWSRLLAEQGLLDGLTVVTADSAHWFSATLEIVGAHEELDLGLFRFRKGECWMPVVVARRGERAQRVHIHNLTCETCGWSGLVGNPCYWELYLEAPEKNEALDRAFGIPRFQCPDCGDEFEVRIFWVAPPSLP